LYLTMITPAELAVNVIPAMLTAGRLAILTFLYPATQRIGHMIA
jgi:hypothetical protein